MKIHSDTGFGGGPPAAHSPQGSPLWNFDGWRQLPTRMLISADTTRNIVSATKTCCEDNISRKAVAQGRVDCIRSRLVENLEEMTLKVS